MSYSKLYSRINWENEPSTDTPINETNLNKMDSALDGIDDRVISLDTRTTNLEGYETAAAQSATAAAGSASTAETQAILSRSFAKGDTNTRTGETTDNAKYYKEQAEAAAASIIGTSIAIYDTLSQAQAAAPSLPDNKVVIVLDDTQ